MFLNNSNWLDYALNNYDTDLNLKCEIYDDLRVINNIKKNITLYNNGDDNQIRSIINGIIVLVNVFGVQCSFNLLMYKLDKEFHSIIKTCYYYLRYIRNDLKDIQIVVENCDVINIEIDKTLLQKLYTLI